MKTLKFIGWMLFPLIITSSIVGFGFILIVFPNLTPYLLMGLALIYLLMHGYHLAKDMTKED